MNWLCNLLAPVKLTLALTTILPLSANTGLERQIPEGINFPINPSAAEYQVVDAFPGITFENPTAIVSAPGDTNRLFIVERKGRVIVIPDLANPVPQLFLDLTSRVHSDIYEGENAHGTEGICGLTFHPGWKTNRLFYLTYCTLTNGVIANRLSQFTITPTRPNFSSNSSERPLITQVDEGFGHSMNDVQFGPDGYLYVAIGDEGDGRGAGDEFNNSQRIDKDFFSAILRLDVDGRPGNLPPNPHPSSHGGYWIPADNPFVDTDRFNDQPVDPSQVRTEFYAVGFRNPWRIHFDRETGNLYAGDVGKWGAEEVDVVTKGGNYGWGFREGANLAGPKGSPPFGVTLIPPIYEYPHGYNEMQGMCIIGGVVYRGTAMPPLHGKYIFGDWSTGNIWCLSYDGTSASDVRRISSVWDISSFGIDPRNGDVLISTDKISLTSGEKIYRLQFKSGSGAGDLPVNLADTGLFEDLQTLTPTAGLVPYDVNVPLWSDDADKLRWFGILNDESKIEFNPDGNWQFPSGTLWVKHFQIELEKGNPSSTKRLETRVLVKNDQGIHGATYHWNSAGTGATLVPAEGMEESFEVNDGGTIRTQVWRYPSRGECLRCHTASGGYSLGFNTAQLNREFSYPLGVTNQIIAFEDAGYLHESDSDPHTWRKLAPLDDESWSAEARVRSYIAANCSFCHNPAGVNRAHWDGRLLTPLSEAGLINGELVESFGHPDNRVIVPGAAELSVLLTRMNHLGRGRMPPLGSTVVHEEAVNLLERWIETDLDGYQTYAEWVSSFDLNDPTERGLDADPDGDGGVNWLEYLLQSSPIDPGEGFSISLRKEEDRAQIQFLQHANRGFEVQVTGDLLDPGAWKPLDSPLNQPFFSVTNRSAVIDFPLSPSQNSFFRVRVYEP